MHDPFGKPSYLCVIYFALAAGLFAKMAWKFYMDRQQFTLQTLMLVTLGAAILCSVCSYVPIVPLLIFFGFPLMMLAMCGPPSLYRSKDGPKNLKSEISDPESEISDPKPAIQNPKSKI
jgi:hypothetical protein